MGKIGIFFGSDTGNTRRVAKSIHKKLGDRINKAFLMIDGVVAMYQCELCIFAQHD